MDEMNTPAAEGPPEAPVRPLPGEMLPFEWMAWEARDLGAPKLAEACDWLVASRNAALNDASWRASRRFEAQAECERLRRHLETIRDTGMTADDAAEHAAAALRPNAV